MDIEEIHEYLEGALHGQDLLDFERRLGEDKELQIEVKLQRQMMLHLTESDELNKALKSIESVHQSYTPTKNQSKRPIWLLVSVTTMAASITLFVLVNTLGKTNSTDDLYNAYFNSPTASFGVKGDQSEEALVKAEIAFNNKSYDNALVQFNEYVNLSETKNHEVHFYIGLCHLELHNYDEALNSLNTLRESSPVFVNDCTWYMALAHLKKNDKKQAIQYLQELANSSYSDKSKTLILQINSLDK